MKITFEFYEKLPESAIQSLWDQNICMDDWDYLLFFENSELFEKSEYFDTILVPKSYVMGTLLSGCSSNKWFPVDDFMGRKGVIGIAYHG